MWGEINEISTPFSSNEQDIDLTEVIELAQHPNCLSNYDITSSKMKETKEIILPAMDSTMLYAAALHQYMGTMKNVIQDAELAVEFNLTMQTETPGSVLPEQPVVTEIHHFKKPLNFIEKEYSNFSMGFGKDPPHISDYTRKHIEKQCIATMLAHIGFKSSYNDVMDVLVDVLECFFKNICGQLRESNDFLLSGENSGFPDIVEKVLTQSGLGGIHGIYDYYENRIKKYQSVLEGRCGGISGRYQTLLAPGNVLPENKTEILDDNFMDEQDIPEVHFTAGDGEGAYLQPFLESGFQMLSTLEEGQFVT